jgi:hypothetical protein
LSITATIVGWLALLSGVPSGPLCQVTASSW